MWCLTDNLKAMKKVRITQVRSGIGRPQDQKDTLVALRLRKMNQSVEVDMENVKCGKTTTARSGELFSEEKKALAFFEKLVRNLATPIDLAYIVEDEFA